MSVSAPTSHAAAWMACQEYAATKAVGGCKSKDNDNAAEDNARDRDKDQDKDEDKDKDKD